MSMKLTEREKEIAEYLADGMSSQEIAAKIERSVGYINNVAGALMIKKRVTSRNELLAALQTKSEESANFPLLTDSEREIADEIATGKSYGDIARKLGYAYATISDVSRMLRHKLNERNLSALVIRLNREGFGNA